MRNVEMGKMVPSDQTWVGHAGQADKEAAHAQEECHDWFEAFQGRNLKEIFVWKSVKIQ